MGRAPCCDKANVKKGPWSPEEDAKLKEYIHKFGTVGNWIALPHKAGLKRCGKSCRLRWLNYLRPNIKHGDFSDEEDKIICSLYASIGSRWSIIAAHLPGRTDNDIKNYWNTKLKKKLMGITISKTPSSSSSYIYHNHHHHMLHNPMLNHNPSSSNTMMTMPFLSFDITQQTMQNHHHQVKDNNALLILEGVGNDDHQVKCEDQGINIINQDYNEAYYGENSCNQSSVLDHDYGLEEIKELIINTNINVGNNFNYFGENKENGSTKIMYY